MESIRLVNIRSLVDSGPVRIGRSYLCRMIDMLHMGFVDEVVFGREVLTRLPELVAEWLQTYGAAAHVTPESGL